MVSEFFLNIVFTLLTGMLEILPVFEWSVETSAFEYFLDIVRVVGYMLPVETVTTICALVLALTLFRICIAIPRVIWELLPFV